MLSYREICAKANQYIDLCIGSDYAREQQLVHVINEPNKAVVLSESISMMGRHCTIKMEGFETFDPLVWEWCKLQAAEYNHVGPVSAHLFIAPTGGYTFNEHTDPDHVLICVLTGEKGMVVDGVRHDLKAGETLYIPADVKHYAVNDKGSIMVSLGLEKWMVDKL